MHPLLVSAAVTAATWDAWRWYLTRIRDAPEEAATLVLTIALLALAGRMRGVPPAGARGPAPVMPAAVLLVTYAASYVWLPPIMRAAIAVTATLFCLHVAVLGRRPPVAFIGLAVLALPVLPSLQFTLGYPLRVACAAFATVLLQMHGLSVEQQGTFLAWRGDLIELDAPCSGVNMLWAALLLTLMACVWLRLRIIKLLLAVLITIVLVVASNVLRTVSLFYVEAGLVTGVPAWWHEGIGMAAFALSALLTLAVIGRLGAGGVRPCSL